jgi:hypothetical protein
MLPVRELRRSHESLNTIGTVQIPTKELKERVSSGGDRRESQWLREDNEEDVDSSRVKGFGGVCSD